MAACRTQKPVALCGVANLVSTTLHLRNDAQARKLPTHANMLQTLLLQRPGRNYTDAFEHMVPDVPNAVGDSGDDGPSDDVIGDAALRVSTSSSVRTGLSCAPTSQVLARRVEA